MSEVPPLPRVAETTIAGSSNEPAGPADDLSAAVAAAFRSDGVLACAMPDFEPRAGQVTMAGAVARSFQNGGVLLAEAGTGTGKTVAYLVPAILSRERVLVSTGTKNLQEQIFFKDIPALRDALGVQFTATCLKGRANYLCLHRLEKLTEGATEPPGNGRGGLIDTRNVIDELFLTMIRRWSRKTETGDRAELEDVPEDLPAWSDVSASADTCLGSECPRFDECFVTRARQRAAASDIVIVNHHLLCADAAVRQSAYGEVIPSCSRAILDEAHQLEDVATQYFGVGVSNYRLDDLANDVERLVAAGRVSGHRAGQSLSAAAHRLRQDSSRFFDELVLAHRRNLGTKGDERIRVTDESLVGVRPAATDLTGALDVIQTSLAVAAPHATTAPDADPPSKTTSDRAFEATVEGPTEELAALTRRAGEIRDELRFLMRAGDEEYVYFVEWRGRGVFLRASPIDVSSILREVLFDRMRTTVLTSATLTVDGTFDYLRARLGVPDAEEVSLPSEFDFRQQAILYLPRKMPDPRSDLFAPAAGREVIEILKRTRGRAFVLFTSYATMKAVRAIAAMALEFPIFVQGTAPRSQLLEQFKRTPHSVLFATSSFWQGVDVVGEALSCVIVDKLPFASPADPITSARIDAIRARGGDPFGEYQVPIAILSLQQGLGRLIRHRRDRGVLAVLDPRMRTRGYGQRFVRSLPPAPIVYDLSGVEDFFAS
ncbi:MAG TPA: ATP-dependent DNA helicase [Vicinamibacterales bacterium]|nr:ATP-dependent DNA helicase [Vicinamibacterales bacterium]